jgi:hypothetical protein
MLKRLFFSLILVGSFVIAIAQPGGGGDPGGGQPVPLGGIELLLAAGAALGVKRIVSRNKKL